MSLVSLNNGHNGILEGLCKAKALIQFKAITLPQGKATATSPKPEYLVYSCNLDKASNFFFPEQNDNSC